MFKCGVLVVGSWFRISGKRGVLVVGSWFCISGKRMWWNEEVVRMSSPVEVFIFRGQGCNPSQGGPGETLVCGNLKPNTCEGDLLVPEKRKLRAKGRCFLVWKWLWL